jgi:8-oxo-dGTP diphosphatase
MSLPEFLVVVGIIIRDGQCFIAKRDFKLHMGGRWEFPGGKVESGETLNQALSRELHEEIGIEATDFTHFHTIHYQYNIKKVRLECFIVQSFQGEPHGKEGQETRWIMLSELAQYEFPDANRSLIEKLKTLLGPKTFKL